MPLSRWQHLESIRQLPMTQRSRRFYLILRTYAPSGGINSNAIDMSKWLPLQMNNGIFDGKRIINESSLEYMHTPKTIIGANPITGGYNAYYGQG
jgi:CubicO group peptidase (beta-lactamase class C family)